jgi:hypothetical protein
MGVTRPLQCRRKIAKQKKTTSMFFLASDPTKENPSTERNDNTPHTPLPETPSMPPPAGRRKEKTARERQRGGATRLI